MFTATQQRAYRAIVARAWKNHRSATDHTTAPDQWVRDNLARATGKRTTQTCDPSRDFERAMRHFEEIAGDDIQWAMRTHGADRRRILHNCRDAIAKLQKTDKLNKIDWNDDYLLTIARTITSRPITDLGQLNQYETRHLIIILKKHLSR